MVYAMVIHQWYAACLLFTYAAVTDVLDGALARWLKEETVLGTYLDPLADKLLLISCYSTFAYSGFLPSWFVLFVIGKELLLMVGALFLALVQPVVNIRPSTLGKATTFMQICFVWLLFFTCFGYASGKILHAYLIMLAIGMTIALVDYLLIGYTRWKNYGKDF